MILLEEYIMRMSTASEMKVACILAILVLVMSSYIMIQAAPTVLSDECTRHADNTTTCVGSPREATRGYPTAADCRDLQTNMANDTADHFYAGLFQQLNCGDILARTK